MQIPQINLNGSDPQRLRQNYFDAYTAMQEAIKQFERIDFHGRDYQTLPRNAFGFAQFEHRQRYTKLVTVRDELMAIIVALDEQIAERSKR